MFVCVSFFGGPDGVLIGVAPEAERKRALPAVSLASSLRVRIRYLFLFLPGERKQRCRGATVASVLGHAWCMSFSISPVSLAIIVGVSCPIFAVACVRFSFKHMSRHLFLPALLLLSPMLLRLCPVRKAIARLWKLVLTRKCRMAVIWHFLALALGGSSAWCAN